MITPWRTRPAILLTLAIGFLGNCAGAVGQTEVPGKPAAGPDSAVLEGFWPTQRMLDSMLKRWAVEAADKYGLRPDQQDKLEGQMLERWTHFLQENRREIQPLINEYFEARMGVEPPTAEQISDWASRALPVYQRVREQFDAGAGETRAMLSAGQRIRFEAEQLKARAGLAFLESNLKRWSVGNYREDEWWEPVGGRHRARSNQPSASRPADADPATAALPPELQPGELPARLTDEFGAWEEYVEEFCTRFNLDRSQRNAAESMLRELLDRARAYSQSHRAEIIRVEELINNPAEVDEASVNRDLETVYGPIDRMFQELDERLNKLPTPAQRRRVEAAEAAPQP